MAFCLPKEIANKFKEALVSGKIDPAKLSEMDSASRHEFFSKIVGENARDVNALFESKLLLKNQQAGMINWAKKVAGITEAARTDLISRIGRMDKVLSAADQQSFLEDLASKKLGTDVSFESAQKIVDLSQKIREGEASISPTEPMRGPNRLQYGEAKVELQKYIGDLKDSNKTTTIGEKALNGFGLTKAINAAFDISYWGRQGYKLIFTHPVEWATDFAKSAVDTVKQLGLKGTNDSIINGIKADVYSRPNAMNGLYSKMKIDIGIDREEAYPTSLPEKIPLLGRLYKASEVNFTGGALRLRADLADKYIDIAKEAGVDITDKAQAESIGKLVNELTGRGYLGRAESLAKGTNVMLFSPRSLKASIDFLTAHQAQKGVTPFVRKQAAVNLIKVATGAALTLAVAKAIAPKSVETDPRSADFGKIRIGNTRIDVTGGMASLITLGARIGTWSTKSSLSGNISAINTGKFGGQTGDTLIQSFFLNKLSPFAGAVNDVFIRGVDFKGNKPTLEGEIKNLIEPLPAKNVEELLTTKGAMNVYIASLLDSLGFVTNTYTK